MKLLMKNLLIVLFFSFIINANSQNIGINTTGASADSTAILDVNSTTGGLLIPRMTEEQRDDISSPANSLQIFNTTTNCWEIYVNTWHEIWCEERFTCGGTLTDSRDDNTYPTVQIGEQCWMSKNLAYLPVVHNNTEFVTQGNDSLPGYGIYGYNGSDTATAKGLANYSTYGVLYNWYATMQGTSSCNCLNPL